ncbi:MFS transporter [Streptomyces flavofungini]|uniref:MFS transporter n=1 Tax=Streptomyces flavofungini TaxID=68200 RepID=A0ABS0X7B2_9ACTN|nr:MFS transporter [Streptomyces flavofungini]MBJ3809097.1 MFS transporter [Streptomyces flavofungini]GHC68518.1 MFS transporter [Streptomyces flavofungini]
MYLSQTRAADSARTSGGTATVTAGSRADGARTRVPATVLTLGAVSLVTDASAEMVTAVLPLYLMYGLGVGYLQLGALDGLYTGATALLRLGGGYAADRLGRPKAVAATGYGLSALTKLGLPWLGTSAGSVGLLVAADRTGKGIRTAPRDALITFAAPEEHLGRAFGVHRALDATGALLGPLLAFAVLLAVPGDYDAVFMVSFLLAAAGVVLLAVCVRPDTTPSAAERTGCLRPYLRALHDRDALRVVVAAGLLGLVTAGDMFLYVALQRQLDLPHHVLPLLPVGTALVFMAAAAPVGRLADRVGRWRLFLAGHLLLLCAYVGVAAAPGGWVPAGIVLLLHGLFYAATDGVLIAHVGPVLPTRVRTTGLAVVQTSQALARAGGALAFGAVAAGVGLTAAFTAFAAALLVLVAGAAAAHAPRRTR